jgi:NADPH:quinone reductase-like Zn-dependent oxidoreductase
MKAIVYTEYGSTDVLRYAEVEKPAPEDGEVLVKIGAAAVNPLDWHYMRGTPYPMRLMAGLRRPKLQRLGADLAGRVEAVGRGVTRFKPGDEVFGVRQGAFAEYVCAPEDKLALKPAGLSFEEAAAVPVAAITALHGLRDKGGIRAGQKVLVDGASGGVGTFAVQIAKAFGAEVTAVCSPGNAGKLRALGADEVIDYSRQDFTRNGERYELILGANAYHSLFDYRRALSARGTFVLVGGSGALVLQLMFLGPLLSRLSGKKSRFMIAKLGNESLTFLKELLEAGKIKPVIDRRYPLSETAEAIRYVEAGHAKGKVIITVGA